MSQIFHAARDLMVRERCEAHTSGVLWRACNIRVEQLRDFVGTVADMHFTTTSFLCRSCSLQVTEQHLLALCSEPFTRDADIRLLDPVSSRVTVCNFHQPIANSTRSAPRAVGYEVLSPA